MAIINQGGSAVGIRAGVNALEVRADTVDLRPTWSLLSNPIINGPDTITTVTQSGSTDATLTNSYNLAVPVAAAPITFLGGNGYTPFGSVARALVPGNGGAGAVGYESFVDGTVVELQMEVISGKDKFQLIVDDKYVGSGSAGSVVPTLFSTNDGVYVKLVFSTPGPHLVRVEREGVVGLSGFRMLPYEGAQPSTRRYPKVLFVTDSYGITASPSNIIQSACIPNIAGLLLGWNVYANTLGGTGYTGTTSPFDAAARLDVVAAKDWDAIVNLGGINDIGNSATVAARALQTWQAQRLAAPNAKIIVGGTWTGTFLSGSATVEQNLLTAFNTWADPNSIFVPISNSAQTKPFTSGDGRVIVFTAALTAATSATLATTWAGTTGTNSIRFSDGTVKSVTLTNGSSAVSWTGAVTASAIASAYVTAGTGEKITGPDGTHPYARQGHIILARKLAAAIAARL